MTTNQHQGISFMNNNKNDLFILILGRLIVFVIGVLSIRVSTTYLDPLQFGQLSILITIQTFIGLCLINPVGQHINRFTHQWWREGTLLERFKYYVWYVLFSSLLGVLVTVLTLGWQSSALQLIFMSISIFLIINSFSTIISFKKLVIPTIFFNTPLILIIFRSKQKLRKRVKNPKWKKKLTILNIKLEGVVLEL